MTRYLKLCLFAILFCCQLSVTTSAEEPTPSEFSFSDYLAIVNSDRLLSPEDWVMAYGITPKTEKPFVSALLEELSISRNNVAKMRMVERLGIEKSTEAVSALTKILQDTNIYSGLRYRSAKALGNIGSKEAVTPLIKAMQDDVPGVRWNAAEALGKIGDNSALRALRSKLNEPDETIRANARKSISQITGAKLEYCNYRLGFSLSLPPSWKINDWGRLVEILGSESGIRIETISQQRIVEEQRFAQVKTAKGWEPLFLTTWPLGEDYAVGTIQGRKSVRKQTAGPSWKFKEFIETGILLTDNTDYYFITYSVPDVSYSDVRPRIEDVVKTFRSIPYDVHILNSVEVSESSQWQKWLHLKWARNMDIKQAMRDQLNLSLSSFADANTEVLFGDYNNDGRPEALVVSVGKKMLEREWTVVNNLEVYAWDKNRWEELLRYSPGGVYVAGKKLSYIKGDNNFYTVGLSIDQNGNLAFSDMLNGASDTGVMSWMPLKRSFCHSISGECVE